MTYTFEVRCSFFELRCGNFFFLILPVLLFSLQALE